MLNIIICDDSERDRNNVIKIVNEFIKRSKLECDIHIFNDYNSNFDKIIESSIPFKIYLLDIETPSKSGIDIARQIRKTDVDSTIIFLTGHEELGNIVLRNDLMFSAFINKFDNLEGRLNKTLKKVLLLLNKKKILKFTDKNVLYTIDANDILYITKESFERKTIIKTDYAEYKINKSLFEIIQMLDGRFVQTHRACYINSDRKVTIDKTNKIVTFDNGETIDLVSDKYKKELV